MAYYFLFPELDTTLYSHPDRSEMNAGSDEILEIVKERGSTDNILYPSRIILKFKNDDLIDTIGNIVGHNNFNNITTASLQLTAAEPKNLISTLNLELFALSQSWDEGTGRFSNLPTSSNGCSWIFRDNDVTKTQWTTGSTITTGLTFGSSSININELLTPVRPEDAGDDLWSVFNVVQEKIIEGDFEYIAAGKARKARQIKNFKQDQKINKELFELALEYVK